MTPTTIRHLQRSKLVGSQTPSARFAYGSMVPFSYKLTVAEVKRQTSGELPTAVVAVLDKLYNRVVTATYVSDFKATIERSSANTTDQAVEVLVVNPAVLAPPDGTGTMAFQSNGTTTIIARPAGGAPIQTRQVTTKTMTSQLDYLIGYGPTTLAKHLRDQVDLRLETSAITVPADEAILQYSSRNDSSGTYVLNPRSWATGIDLTCVSVWNSTGGVTMSGTLISPRHIIFAAHFQIGVGATIRFVGRDGVTVTRTMTGKIVANPYELTSSDWCIGVLDADVPSTVTFAKVVPTNWGERIASFAGTPVVSSNQRKEVTVRQLAEVSTLVYFRRSTDSESLARGPMYRDAIVGDSGSPNFWIINNHPVLWAVYTFGGGGSGTNIEKHHTAINAAMTSLGGGYQLTTVDLSGFPLMS